MVFFVVLTGSRCAPGRLGTIDQYHPGSTEIDDQYYDSSATPTTEPDNETMEIYTLDYGDSSEIPLTLQNRTIHIDSFTENISTTSDQYVYADR